MDRPKLYHRLKLSLSLMDTFLGWVFLLVLLLTPLATWFADITTVTGHEYLHFLLFILSLGLLSQLVVFPLTFYDAYILEKRFGLSDQTVPAWLWHGFKGIVVSAVIGVPVLLVFFICLDAFGVAWWLPVSVLLFLFSVILGRLAPTLVFPLFYRFLPLDEDNPVRERIAQLCHAVGLDIQGVYRFNLSKTTRKANAAFTGLGKSRRVLLADTLLDNFEPDEILAIVGHELGHFRKKHIWKMMGLSTLLTFAGMYVISRAHFQLAGGEITSLPALPWLALLLSGYGFFTGPISNAYSRRHEFAADRFAIELTGEGKSLADGLERLAELNLADRDPHPLVEFLFHSHPSIRRRLAVTRAV